MLHAFNLCHSENIQYNSTLHDDDGDTTTTTQQQQQQQQQQQSRA
jgi:hypothetical protein